MEDFYAAEELFENIDYKNDALKKGEYEDCEFNNCDLSETDLSDVRFIECTFNECNLSLAKINGTAFRDVVFRKCKLMGLRFDTCNDFGIGFRFDNCMLDHSTFYRLKIRRTVFKECRMQETDFTECDLTGSVFDGCDLLNASFMNTILERSDLRGSVNYSIDPGLNRIRKAKFSMPGAAGLLDKYDIEIE